MGRRLLDRVVAGIPAGESPVRHVEHLPQRAARYAEWPDWAAPDVVDACHSYRGVFGSHVALLLRRLRRIACHYGADPVFVLASATVSDPGALAERLTGARCRAITDDGSPRGDRTVVLWEPPLLDD